LLYLLDASIQIIHQVLLLRVCRLPFRLCLKLYVGVFYLLLQLLDLLLVLLNDFLAEVGSLCKLFLNLLMVYQLLAQIRNDTFHLMVPEHKVLRALRLVV